jgi:hypothetical protein
LIQKIRNDSDDPYQYDNFKATELPTYVALPEGFTATQSNINTIGDNRDSAYFSTVEIDALNRSGSNLTSGIIAGAHQVVLFIYRQYSRRKM